MKEIARPTQVEHEAALRWLFHVDWTGLEETQINQNLGIVFSPLVLSLRVVPLMIKRLFDGASSQRLIRKGTIEQITRIDLE